MRRSKRAFSPASRFSRTSGVSEGWWAGSMPGHVNFMRLVLTKETFSPSWTKRSASALIAASGSVKYSLRLSTV